MKNVEEKAGELITETSKGIIIDWDKLRLLRKRVYDGTLSSEEYNQTKDKLLDALLKKNILTYRIKGTYRIVGPGGSFSPKFNHPASSELFFVRREEAEKYREQFHRNIQFSLGIAENI